MATPLVQQHLRAIFSGWGLPGAFRVDNGKPWGSARDLPPVLALWLLGLGVKMYWNPPRRPQDNGVVERSQGTGKRWAEPERCHSAAELQQEMDLADRLQRENYPYLKVKSRLEVFPELVHSGRAYLAEDEPRCWDLQAALQHLSGYVLSRRVDSSGNVSMYDRNVYVGVVHVGKDIQVMFDPGQRQWLCCDAQGRQLRVQAAAGMEAEAIRSLWTKR